MRFAETRQEGIKQLAVAIDRTGEQLACARDHFELQHVVDLRAEPVTRAAESSKLSVPPIDKSWNSVMTGGVSPLAR